MQEFKHPSAPQGTCSQNSTPVVVGIVSKHCQLSLSSGSRHSTHDNDNDKHNNNDDNDYIKQQRE